MTVEKDIPLEVDAGFLTVTDLNPIDVESYKYVVRFFVRMFAAIKACMLSADLEDYLMSTARDGVQALVSSLFSLPITSSEDGPLAQLPPPTTQLPRAKPLPKPKPLTKWQQFAKAKGIQHSKKEKRVWDEEKQEWVERWGWKGANKTKESQWLTEVPANAGTSLKGRLVLGLFLWVFRCRVRPVTRGEEGTKGKNLQKRAAATTESRASSTSHFFECSNSSPRRSAT